MLKRIKKSHHWKKRGFRWSVRFLIGLLFIAVLAPFIANDVPLISRDEKGIHFPVMEELLRGNHGMNANVDWKAHPQQVILYAPVVWKAGASDVPNCDYVSPFAAQYREDNSGRRTVLPIRFRHFLGTDVRGTDVLADVIYGARISLMIALFSATFATFLGILLGGFAAWFGNDRWKLSIGKLIAAIVVLIPVIHLLTTSDLVGGTMVLKWMLVGGLLAVGYFGGIYFDKHRFFPFRLALPLDAFIMRLTELMSSFPKIILILVFAGFGKPSWVNVVLILSFTGWTEISRVVRAEFQRIGRFQYIDAARVTGARDVRIIFHHILINALPSVSVAFVYTIVTNVLIESGLSFLGIGVPPDIVTWGSLLSSGKENLNAWWLILLPGLLLAFTISALQTIATAFREQKK
jgi:peptide/nickel transport system permease protein